MLVPANALPASKRFCDLRLVEIGGLHDIESPGEKRGRSLFGERHGLLRRQRERVLFGVIIDISGRSLAGQPFAYISLVQTGLLREFRGSDRHAIRHRLVDPEAVAEQNARAAKRDAEVADQLSDERIQFVRIWFTHDSLLSWFVVVVLAFKSDQQASRRHARRRQLRPVRSASAPITQRPWHRRSCPAWMLRIAFAARPGSGPADGRRESSARNDF